MIRALFICGKNQLRSPTAEQIFAEYDQVETDSAGVSNDADIVVSAEQIEWADIIFVMDQGRIVEPGKHAELLAAGGHYAKLHAMQFHHDNDRNPAPTE